MNKDNKELETIDLDENLSDHAMSLVQAISSLGPGGGFLSQIFKKIIPNQQIHRIVETLKIVISKVNDINDRLENEESIDLLQDAIIQASRALTAERREYISNLLKNGLTRDEQSHDQKKKLFITLDSLNDTEIIFLKYYSYNSDSNEARNFRNQHTNTLRNFRESGTDDTSEANRETFYESYNKNFERLGLILEEPTRFTGMRSRELTQLGRLLIDYIEVPD